MAFPRLYTSPLARIVANTQPTADWSGACWQFTGRKRCRFGYGRMNFWVPGLGKAVPLTVHIVSWICLQVDETLSPDELYLAYLEVRHSGLELDHMCVNPGCANPEHLQPLTPKQNIALRDQRRFH